MYRQSPPCRRWRVSHGFSLFMGSQDGQTQKLQHVPACGAQDEDHRIGVAAVLVAPRNLPAGGHCMAVDGRQEHLDLPYNEFGRSNG